jgi:hypothetical protein
MKRAKLLLIVAIFGLISALAPAAGADDVVPDLPEPPELEPIAICFGIYKSGEKQFCIVIPVHTR